MIVKVVFLVLLASIKVQSDHECADRTPRSRPKECESLKMRNHCNSPATLVRCLKTCGDCGDDTLRYISLPGGNITYHQARSACLARNGDLPKPKTQALWTALVASPDVASWGSKFYLGIQRDDKGRWRWLGENDEAPYTVWESIPDKGYNCAGYVKGYPWWFQTQCDNNTLNYKFVTVCEIGAPCPTRTAPMATANGSTSTKKPTYSMRYGGRTSFSAARSICLKEGLDLPKPRTQELWTALLAAVPGRFPHFYLGIQRDDEGRWRWVGENDEATFTLWTSIPDNGYNCVRGYKYQPTSWIQEPCHLMGYTSMSMMCEIGGPTVAAAPTAPCPTTPAAPTTTPAVKWTSDPATGVHYGLLNSSTLDENNTMQTCEDQNAKLPEPRSEEENAFLYRLINHNRTAVLLGLNAKDGGVWRWNSDNSLVTWFNWKKKNGPKKTRKMCVVFHSKKYPKAWITVKCKKLSRRFKRMKKILICQRGSDTTIQQVSRGWTFVPSLTALLGFCLASHFL